MRVLTVLGVLGVLIVLFVAGVVATREDQALLPAPADLADVALPDRALVASDVEQVRFGVTIRGYRMSEVDALLERVAAELADRDARLAALSSGLMASADSGRSAHQDAGAPARVADASGLAAADPVAFPDVLPADPAPAPPTGPPVEPAAPSDALADPAGAQEHADRD